MMIGQTQIREWIKTETRRVQIKTHRKSETISKPGGWGGGLPTKVVVCAWSRRRGNEGGSDKGIICKLPLWPPILLTLPENMNAIFPGNGIYSFTAWRSGFLLYLGWWKSHRWPSHHGVSLSLSCLLWVCFFLSFAPAKISFNRRKRPVPGLLLLQFRRETGLIFSRGHESVIGFG